MASQLDSKAIDILHKNDRGGFTVPTARLYPYQWNWDSAFVALGFATFDRDRAWKELEYLLEGQWANGMVPSILFRNDDPDYFPGPSVWQTQTVHTPTPPIASTGISQPPILACIMRELVESGDKSDLQRASALLDRTLAWHKWYQAERAAEGIVATVHPWETGRDNCPDWQLGFNTMEVDPDLEPYERQDIKHANPEQRPSKEEYDKYLSIVKFGRDNQWDQKKLTNDGPFLMADPCIHFILLRANKDLLLLAEKLENKQAVKELRSLIEKGEQATQYFWNDSLKAFAARNLRTGEFSNGFSNASALCFFADTGTQEQQMHTIGHIQRIQQQVKFLLPSWDPAAPMYDAQRYWCGPIWPQMNYLLYKGLEEQGHAVLASTVRDDMAALIEQSGFYECFNPETGAGCIGTDFSWTAAIWLAWASPNKQRTAA